MAFYARYIPPTNDGNNVLGTQTDDINPRPSKKKKFSGRESQPHLPVRNIQSSLPLAEHDSVSSKTLEIGRSNHEVIDEASKPKKVKKVKALRNIEEDKVSEDDSRQALEHGKNQKIRAKFEKAGKTWKRPSGKPKERDIIPELESLEKVKSKGLAPLPQPPEIPDTDLKSTIVALPNWLTKPLYVRTEATTRFDSLPLSKETINHLCNAGFVNAFAVQSAVIPILSQDSKHHKGDLCISATTGSGKSLAYTLPIIEALKGKPVTKLRALIVVPTRELVAQAQEVFRICCSSLKVGTAVGNRTLRQERDTLIESHMVYSPERYQKIQSQKPPITSKWDLLDQSDDSDEEIPEYNFVVEYESKVDVLICTPGRLVDHLRSTKGFTLEDLQWFVIDEADRLLDQSFQQWLEIVIPALEKKPKRSTFLNMMMEEFEMMPEKSVRKVILSATMTRDFSKLLALKLQNPTLVVVEGSRDQGQQDGLGHLENNATSIIPRHLREEIVSVREAGEKPLYLVELIQESFAAMKPTWKSVKSTQSSGSTASTSSSESESDDSSESSESFQSSSVNSTDTSSNSDVDDTSNDDSDTDLDDSSDSSSTTEASINGSKMDIDVPQSLGEPGDQSSHGILVFTNTNESAMRLCRLLTILRPSWSSQVSPLTKSIGTSSGRKTLAAFKKRKITIIIASDRASRGLDIERLAHVINYDMPQSLTNYIHRIGRTARAGRSGIATTLVAHHQAKWFWNEIGRSTSVERVDKVIRKQIPLENITEKDRKAYEFALKQLGEEARGQTGKG
jgi:ATP-dependent RNA helicase DDX51/DBP6